MFTKAISKETVSELMELNSVDALKLFLSDVGASVYDESPEFTLRDALVLKLAGSLLRVGVDCSKALSYAEAVLGYHMAKGWNEFQKLIEDGNQDLFCLIEDNQLARIFVRGRDDGREFDVGAVKPVLLPTTRCEVNVGRAVRPVMYRATR